MVRPVSARMRICEYGVVNTGLSREIFFLRPERVRQFCRDRCPLTGLGIDVGRATD
jgi:hypothetical protein